MGLISLSRDAEGGHKTRVIHRKAASYPQESGTFPQVFHRFSTGTVVTVRHWESRGYVARLSTVDSVCASFNTTGFNDLYTSLKAKDLAGVGDHNLLRTACAFNSSRRPTPVRTCVISTSTRLEPALKVV